MTYLTEQMMFYALSVRNCALALVLREKCLSEGHLYWRWVLLSRDGDDSMTAAILLIHCLYIILIYETIICY